MNDKEKYIFDVIYDRRSIRNFIEDKPVEKDKIVKLLKAAMAAPSACNIQPWEFIIVNEASILKEIKENVAVQGNYNAPLAIVVCGYPLFIPWEDDIGKIDCAAAIENMLLAAIAMDMGSVWIGGFHVDLIRKLLNIPNNVHPVGIIYFGYPAQIFEPRTQYIEDAVYWGKYDLNREHTKRPNSIV